MKEFIIGAALMVVFTITVIFQNDYNIHQEKEQELKAIAQEAAAAAAQYFSLEEYGNGFYKFNEEQGRLAAESVIEDGLALDDNLRPTDKSYWKNTGQVTYDITFIDHDDYASFPQNIKYDHPRGQLDFLLYGPSVIITIHTGNAHYSSISVTRDSHQIGMHTLDE